METLQVGQSKNGAVRMVSDGGYGFPAEWADKIRTEKPKIKPLTKEQMKFIEWSLEKGYSKAAIARALKMKYDVLTKRLSRMKDVE